MTEKVGVIGLGYVGLPVALAFARHFETVGFDIHEEKVAELNRGHDRTGECDPEELKSTSLKMTANLDDLRGCTFFVVAVPTPIDSDHQPDLTPVVKASETVGQVLEAGGVVVYESTVYPGVTEEIAGPILEKVSGLARNQFKLGYSPERINPGDKVNTLEKIVKIVSGEDAETLERVAVAYERIITAGVHRAPSIKVAEAAKVIENTQRDLNIAFVNELAIIFDRMDIRTKDVLDAAGTKWNFLKFTPGLVGGHCIGVDPYYLTAKASRTGSYPQVILAGRRINDGMGRFIASKLIRLLIQTGKPVKGAKVGILGGTFKENVSDIRNSRVPDIIHELHTYGVETLFHDPYADSAEVTHEYGLELCNWADLNGLDAIVYAVAHDEYKKLSVIDLAGMMKSDGVLIDVKSQLDPASIPSNIQYWSL
ncbi:MAG: nucleotide sugar dehydrogenase [Fimbriimonadaceae bacterium]